MGREALYELIDQIDEEEIGHVRYFLSLVVQRKRDFSRMNFEEVEPLPDEIEIIEEGKREKAAGLEKLFTHEEVWGTTEVA